MGKRIPQDIRVTVFDNIPTGALCVPGLTTASQPFTQIGRKSIESLVQLLEKKEIPEKIILPVELIVRQSCGCYPQAVIKYEITVRHMEKEDDVRLLSERIVHRLLPEFDHVITEDMKKSVLELIQALVLPAE